ncbi:hypothetical protein A4A49_60955, partial [Nicotiana attenuata]
EGIESRLKRPRRMNDERHLNEPSGMSSIFSPQGKPIGGSSTFPLTSLLKMQAHRYMLINCAAVKPFTDEFRDHIRKSTKGRRPPTSDLERTVDREFSDSFPKQVMNDYEPIITYTISTDLKFLARGPAPNARRFIAYNINGFKFRVLSRDQGLKTQNSGVFLTSDTFYVSSSADKSARQAD